MSKINVPPDSYTWSNALTPNRRTCLYHHPEVEGKSFLIQRWSDEFSRLRILQCPLCHRVYVLEERRKAGPGRRDGEQREVKGLKQEAPARGIDLEHYDAALQSIKDQDPTIPVTVEGQSNRFPAGTYTVCRVCRLGSKANHSRCISNIPIG